jgi:hypothetical protein
MLIINKSITINELAEIAQNLFGDMVKGVVDVEKAILAIDAGLHADLETCLLENGSKQENLWGINLYPELKGEDFLEFDSMINIRPTQNNRTRGVDDEKIRQKIAEIVKQRIEK